jgi:hypothetical protein
MSARYINEEHLLSKGGSLDDYLPSETRNLCVIKVILLACSTYIDI